MKRGIDLDGFKSYYENMERPRFKFLSRNRTRRVDNRRDVRAGILPRRKPLELFNKLVAKLRTLK